MKLTVGPLPAGVYWRRRAIVGGVILVVAIMLWTSCGGGSDDSQRRRTSSAASGGAATTAAAEPTVTIQVPTTGDPGAAAASTPSAPPSSAVAVAQPTLTVPPCADADISVVASPEQTVQFRGAYLKFTLKIKNITTHECARDIGADFQELYVTVGAAKIWTSDRCNPPTGSQMAVMKPSIEVSFTHVWNGKANNDNCSNTVTPPAGKYELVGRLGTKISEPVQIQLT